MAGTSPAMTDESFNG